MFSAAALLLATSHSGAVTLGFDPSTQGVTVGSTVIVEVVISGLGDGAAPSLSTFDFDVTFDGGILSFLDFTFGDPRLGDQLNLSGLGSLTGVAAGPGGVNLFELSFDSPADLDAVQAESFTLGTLSVSALSTGKSALGIVVNTLGDADGDLLEADIVAGQVAVTGGPLSVPAPSSGMLLLLGVVGLVSLGIWGGTNRAAVTVRPSNPCASLRVSSRSEIEWLEGRKYREGLRSVRSIAALAGPAARRGGGAGGWQAGPAFPWRAARNCGSSPPQIAQGLVPHLALAEALTEREGIGLGTPSGERF